MNRVTVVLAAIMEHHVKYSVQQLRIIDGRNNTTMQKQKQLTAAIRPKITCENQHISGGREQMNQDACSAGNERTLRARQPEVVAELLKADDDGKHGTKSWESSTSRNSRTQLHTVLVQEEEEEEEEEDEEEDQQQQQSRHQQQQQEQGQPGQEEVGGRRCRNEYQIHCKQV